MRVQNILVVIVAAPAANFLHILLASGVYSEVDQLYIY